MKFFLGFFALALVASIYYAATDASGNGMGWVIAIFAAIGGGVCLYNWRKNDNPLDDSTNR